MEFAKCVTSKAEEKAHEYVLRNAFFDYPIDTIIHLRGLMELMDSLSLNLQALVEKISHHRRLQ